MCAGVMTSLLRSGRLLANRSWQAKHSSLESAQSQCDPLNGFRCIMVPENVVFVNKIILWCRLLLKLLRPNDEGPQGLCDGLSVQLWSNAADSTFAEDRSGLAPPSINRN